MADLDDASRNKDDDKNLEDYYQFDRTAGKKAKDGEKLSFFEKVKNLVPVVKKAAEKADSIKRLLQKKIRALEKALKENQKKQQTKSDAKENDLAAADLSFCRGALKESKNVKNLILEGKKDLEEILATRVERPYSVIVDVALMPLPSDRAKQKDKDNDKDRDGRGGPENGADAPGLPGNNPQKKHAAGRNIPGKLSPEQLAALRGTPQKDKGSQVSEESAAQKEHEDVNLRPGGKEDADKILAARNGIAPENMNKENGGKPLQRREIDFSKTRRPVRDFDY